MTFSQNETGAVLAQRQLFLGGRGTEQTHIKLHFFASFASLADHFLSIYVVFKQHFQNFYGFVVILCFVRWWFSMGEQTESGQGVMDGSWIDRILPSGFETGGVWPGNGLTTPFLRGLGGMIVRYGFERGKKKASPWLKGEAGFWSDVPVFRALRPWKTLQFYQGWL